MVVAMGEFGRTPKINPAGGRDHWPQCWTVSMAGGGVQGRAGDRRVRRDRRVPEGPAGARRSAVAATICTAWASTLEEDLPGPSGRPIRMVDHGVEPITELF